MAENIQENKEIPKIVKQEKTEQEQFIQWRAKYNNQLLNDFLNDPKIKEIYTVYLTNAFQKAKQFPV